MWGRAPSPVQAEQSSAGIKPAEQTPPQPENSLDVCGADTLVRGPVTINIGPAQYRRRKSSCPKQSLASRNFTTALGFVSTSSLFFPGDNNLHNK